MRPDQFHPIADLSPDPLLLITDDGVVVEANPSAVAQLRAHGRNLDAQPGLRLTDLVADPPEALTDQLHRWAQDREPRPGSFAVRGPNGSATRWACEGSLVRPAAVGEPALILLRVMSPAEGTRVAALSRKVEELTAAAHRKDAFLRAVVHDLRNPLTALSAGLETLRRTAAGPQVAETVERMNRQVQRLARLADHLLDASRVIDGLLPLRRKQTDFAAVVRRAVDDRRSDLEAARLAVTADLPAGPVWVDGDPGYLARAVTHLLTNAGRFTPRGGRVEVRLTKDDGRAELIVKDSGEGIPSDVLRGLFEPAAPADQKAERARAGLGLGLTLVQGVVELHGGHLRAVSGGPGRGSEFHLWLPTEAGPAAAVSGAAAHTGGRRVLIVEDNQDAADSLHALLSIFGHDVRVAYTGPEGLAAAREWRPDVIVCDIGLPDLDGYGVAEAVRRDPATAGVLLIAVTGYGQEEDKRRARAAGFDHHLTKPAPPDQLLQLLGS